ncbi:MAG TPA: rhodanese-like domain-containing protein [Polyangiaceae bacterium]|jgi:rhodanese-related sulfurtransferase|nr:rhodanese-like domain-containing protein [Polyangiaceae bacterium]
MNQANNEGSLRVSPEEAQALIGEGYIYVDVRTEQEFEKGHPAGALNVPISRRGASGMAPNPDFMTVMENAFDKNERLLVGCQSGMRSTKAIAALTQAGFTNLRELETGYEGKKDAFGKLIPGWSKKGLPTGTGFPDGQTYEDVKRRAR